MRRLTTVVTMDARFRVDSFHVLTNDSVVTDAQLCQYISCLLGSVCSAVVMGGGQPISSFYELLSMAVLYAPWWTCNRLSRM